MASATLRRAALRRTGAMRHDHRHDQCLDPPQDHPKAGGGSPEAVTYGSSRYDNVTRRSEMAAIMESIDISRRPEDVFSYVTDPLRFSEWQESVVSVRREGDTRAPLAV